MQRYNFLFDLKSAFQFFLQVGKFSLDYFGICQVATNFQSCFSSRCCCPHALSRSHCSQRPAAWRSGGVEQRLGREQKMMLPALCQTSHTPACAKPLVG